MSHQGLVVYCTCPPDSSARLSNELVDRRLAACVSRVEGIASVYHWQGARETSEEHLLIIKTTRKRYAQLEDALKHLHPYELPEIIAVPIEAGLPGYLTWIHESVTAGTS